MCCSCAHVPRVPWLPLQHTGLRWAACHGITEENWTLDCDGKTVDVSVLYFQPDKCATRRVQS